MSKATWAEVLTIQYLSINNDEIVFKTQPAIAIKPHLIDSQNVSNIWHNTKLNLEICSNNIEIG